ncbi:sodium:proton exchanger [Herbaspirillum aquaticum]|uniref:Sodium:proton exchanger n=1 Tax=Herbaspirillum aquaticum TaxID=568783 RepID=A0A225SLL2_9BURK|nr:sodium:proton exchanger [Herbaspirillum aquaticum]OWY31946.1 sodium:proton exchanger [Herbaspirillum aquaticum]
MKRFMAFVAIAVLAILPAVVFRMTGWRPSPLLDTAVFGVAVLSAGFMLSWGAEAAEKRISKGLILAAVALVTVLPEYAVDMYYAYQAGKAPASNYVHYAAANMTGANRLLVGVAWPLMALLHWARTRQKMIPLAQVNMVEIGFLLLASIYAFVIVLKNRIQLWDTVVLIAIFCAYLWQAGRMPKVGSELEEDDEPGPAAALGNLPPRQQWAWMGGLAAVAATVILISAEPFAESIVASGRLLRIDEFLLIQWLAPLASEAPAVVIAILFVTSGRAEGGLVTMISDKINQWTLLVAMLPLAMTIGAGHVIDMPLDPRQHEEFFLTAAQSIFGVSLLLRLRFGVASAVVLFSLFAVQLVVAFVFRNEVARAIDSLTILAWVYLAAATVVFVRQAPEALRNLGQLRSAMAARQLPDVAKAKVGEHTSKGT